MFLCVQQLDIKIFWLFYTLKMIYFHTEITLINLQLIYVKEI